MKKVENSVFLTIIVEKIVQKKFQLNTIINYLFVTVN